MKATGMVDVESGLWTIAEFFGFRPKIHVCYALATDGDRRYIDLAAISALAVGRIHPEAKITILTDDRSLPIITSLLGPTGLAKKVRSVGAYEGKTGARSRFVKTQARQFITGDFLYLDADAIPVAAFDRLFRNKAPICAAIDRSPSAPEGSGFPSFAMPAFKRLGGQPPKRAYLNSGAIFWRDTPAAHRLSALWHENWRRFYKAGNDYADQPTFNYSLESLSIAPGALHDRYNARVGLSRRFADGASIYHFYASDRDLRSSTAIEELLTRFREGACLDRAALDAALARSGMDRHHSEQD